MKILSHLLFDDNGNKVPYKPSPNIGGALHPTYLIIHYTAAKTADSAIGWMVSPQSKVSAHLHLDRDGKFVQLVKFDRVAWHAGKSEWKGLIGLNSHSISIEIQNTGTQEYTPAQMQALAEVTKAIYASYPIKEILGHSDIAPGRKTDPGKHFDMAWLRKQVKPNGLVETMSTTTDVNIRLGAGTNFKSLGVLPVGTEVNVIGAISDWAQVFVCDSKLTGFISRKCLI